MIAAIAIYRIAAFTPQPLDSPGTLRPVLYAGFRWFIGLFGLFDRPEDAFHAWSSICLGAMFVPMALALLHYAARRGFRPLAGRAGRVAGSRWLFFGCIAVFLFLCRYPAFLHDEFNPDEGQFLASAHKLFYDGNFFRSVDCGTSGPINIYPLMLPAIFGFSPDFASSRIIAVLVVFLCTVLLYRAVSLVAAEELARIAALPFAGIFAVFRDKELVHYSSEHVPLLLISLALYLSVRIIAHPERYGWPVFLLGVLTSAAFFAKMQSGPIVVSMAAAGIAYLYATRAGEWWRPAVLYGAGGVPLTAAIVGATVAGGVWNDFWISYVRANTSYAEAPVGFVANLAPFLQYLTGPIEIRFFLVTVVAVAGAHFVERLRRPAANEHILLAQLAVAGGVVAASLVFPAADRATMLGYLALVALFVSPAYVAIFVRKGSLGADPVRWFGVLAFLSIGAALFSIYKAHHPFVHYLLFLFLPLSVALAWILVRQGSAVFVLLTLAFAAASQTYMWSFHESGAFRNTVSTIRAPEGQLIRSLTQAGDEIFVWGWTVSPYLSSGRVPATRDTNVSNCFRSYNLMTSPPEIRETPSTREISEYYRARTLHDLRANPPALFIDAVSPASWFLVDRKYFGFEQFPEIDGFVKANYAILMELRDQRYYIRRDRQKRPPD